MLNACLIFSFLVQVKGNLQTIIDRIKACNTNVLLVEKTVSRDVQESLLKKEITLVFDMKLPRLEKIARCTSSSIISASDIEKNTLLRQCEYFYIEKFMEEHNQIIEGGKKTTKTLMFFEGCSKPLGCTVSIMFLLIFTFSTRYYYLTNIIIWTCIILLCFTSMQN